MTKTMALSLLIFLPLLAPRLVDADEEESHIQSFDGYLLDARIARPSEQTDRDRTVILIHGSGPQNMDSDLTAVAKDSVPILYHKTLSDTLVQAGFTVIRYNKRSFQVSQALAQHPELAQTPEYSAFLSNPLKYFVEDAAAIVAYAKDRFPRQPIYLLGSSQGTYVALQVAHAMNEVSAVALVGFYTEPMVTLSFEQIVYRSLDLFHNLDANADDLLDAVELAAPQAEAQALTAQKTILDINQDQIVSLTEFKAGLHANVVLSPVIDPSYTLQEARYPTPAQILENADFRALFFQGMLDNQTPAYHAQAVQIANQVSWSNPNLSFFYFEGLGHCLDPRDGYNDLLYRPTAEKALKKIVEELGGL